MLALIHFTPSGDEVIGVWVKRWWEEEPTPAYVEPSPHQVLAVETMAAKVEGVSWESFFHQLAGRLPYAAWWEFIEVEDDWEPGILLEMLRMLGELEEPE